MKQDIITDKMTRKQRKTARVKEWKREAKKSDREKAKEERIEAWEKLTGSTYVPDIPED